MIEEDAGGDGGGYEKRQKMESGEFIPRPAEITVRNCTQLDRGIATAIIDLVVGRLLRNDRPLKKDMGPFQTPGDKVKFEWNCGDSVPLGEMAQVIPKELLGYVIINLDSLKLSCINRVTRFLAD